jgi:hypothetical protein
MKEKVIIYGTGKAGTNFYKIDFDYDLFELIAFSDGNIEKQGLYFFDKLIIHPQKIADTNYDKVIVASVYFKEIFETLTKEYGIPPDRIVNTHYKESEKIWERHANYYLKHQKETRTIRKEAIGDGEKILIYTAIAGTYDTLRDPLVVSDRCSYICYTDNPNTKSDIWEIRPLNIINNDIVRSAKKLKVLPHEYFEDYNWSIWVDGKFQIKKDMVELISQYALHSNFISFMHYKRTHAFDEAKACIALGFDNVDVINAQVEAYKKDGFKDDNELIEGGVLFRKHNEPDVIRLMERWWHEINSHSRRDQISFNYCAWKENFFFDLLDMNIYDNPYLIRYPHNK